MAINAIASSSVQYNSFSAPQQDPQETEIKQSNTAAKDSLYTNALFSRMPARTMSFSRSGFSKTPSSALQGGLRGATQLRQTGMNLGISVGVYGGFSLFKQALDVMQGKQSTEGASAIVLSDIIRSGAVGLGASAGGNLTGMAMRVGTGLWATVATVVGSALGASMGRSVIDSIDLRTTMMEWFTDTPAQNLEGLASIETLI